jgi:hypothetical protein
MDRQGALLLTLWMLASAGGCTIHRDITMFGAGYRQPIRGYLEGTMGSGSGEIYITMPDGEALEGRVTFYWGAGYKQETTVGAAFGRQAGAMSVGVTQSGQRMCRATLIGPAGTKLECLADVDPGTAHGVGECHDDKERKFTWHF